MILKWNGIDLKKNTQNKVWWIKLGISIMTTNLLFFWLFSQPAPNKEAPILPPGWVEFHLQAELLTPFQKGKKMMILGRRSNLLIPGILEEMPIDNNGRITIAIREEDVSKLMAQDTWEIIPEIKRMNLPSKKKGSNHEIRY